MNLGLPTLTAFSIALLLPVTAPAQQPNEVATAAEYAVLSSILDLHYAHVAREAHWVIEETRRGTTQFRKLGTTLPAGATDLLSEAIALLPDLPPGLVEDFEARNGRPARLNAECFRAGLPVTLISRAEADRIVYEREAQDRATYPDRLPSSGTVTFSRPGFSPDGQHALVHRSYQCGVRCGFSGVVLLEARSQGWTVKQFRPILGH